MTSNPASLPVLAAAGEFIDSICVVSLPGWRTEALAMRLVSSLCDAGVSALHVGVLQSWQQLAAQPGVRAIALIDGPGAAVVQALITDPDAPVASAAEVWRTSAADLLSAVRATSSRWLCLDASEGLAAPLALRDAIAAWGGSLPPLAPVAHTAPDGIGVWSALLQQALGNNLSVDSSRLFDELRAMCVVLSPPSAPEDPFLPLRRLVAARSATAAHVKALEADLHRQRAEALRTLSAVGTASATLEQLQLKHATTCEQLAACQSQFAGLLERSAELERQLRESDVRRLTLTKWVDAGEAHQATLAQQLKVSEDTGHKQFNALARALVEVNTSQHLLERLHFGAGDTTTFAPWTEDSAPLQVAEFKPGERHEGVQHRHLDYQLAYARQAGRRWDRIDLRLVEHLGRAGLLIFHDGAGPAPLLAWSVCGEENGRPFMLLLPSDSPGRYQLDRLGRSDWRFVIAAVDWLASTLAREADRSDRWLGVARRLRRELAELPPRLRYDGVRVDLPQPGSDGAVTVVLTGSMFGARNFGELTLLWRAGGPLASSSELELQAPSECCDRPLSSWPTNASGDPASSVVLPVGACSAAARRRAWSVFAPIDGTLVLGLLDALPAMAARVASRSAEVSAMAQNGAAYISVPLANTLRNEGHALARSMRWRRLLARAVARLYGAREVDQ